MQALKYNRAQLILSVASTSTTGNSATITLPIADCYRFVLDATTVTAGTLDVAIQDSPDGGTTWYTFEKFAQLSAAAKRQLVFAPTMAVNQAASEAVIADTGASAVATNAPFLQSTVRILYTIATGPVVFKLWLYTVDAGQSAWG